jgi:hypothetical protein
VDAGAEHPLAIEQHGFDELARVVLCVEKWNSLHIVQALARNVGHRSLLLRLSLGKLILVSYGHRKFIAQSIICRVARGRPRRVLSQHIC